MGRPATGIHIRWHGVDGWHDRSGDGRIGYVSFTIDGQRRELSTGQRDATRAAKEAARIYSQELQRPTRPRARRGDSFERQGRAWLDSRASTLSPRTLLSYGDALQVLAGHFRSAIDVTPESTEAFIASELGRVTRGTLLIEMTVLRGVVRSVYGAQAAAALPPVPNAHGTPCNEPQAYVELSPEEAREILRQLELDGDPMVHAWFSILYETGLRPATVRRLSVPEHWWPGQRALNITPRINKAKVSRRLPITELAATALSSVAPPRGLIFPGPMSHRKALRRAARRVLGDRGSRITPYDLRRMRLTHWGEQSGNLPGIQQLALHSSARTTSRYIKPSFRAAESVLVDSREYRGTEKRRRLDSA
jgi:integrase